MNTRLPDPFLFDDGTRVNTVEDWRRRRREWQNLIVDLEYGGLPPTPDETRYEILHEANDRALDASFLSLRLTCKTENSRFSFLLYLLVPTGDGPFTTVLTGDGCWRYLTDAVAQEVLSRGHALAWFNRVEIVPDAYTSERTTGLYTVYPEGSYGALAAWAWGYHRCVDILTQIEKIAPERIAIVGHSRGGKASLLAGATDERIALTAANNSGCGGAGCFRIQGPESEHLRDILGAFPYWFGPKLTDYIDKEETLPFDQHLLKILVAPRALLTTEGLGDLWANPSGTWQTHLAAREVYDFLDAQDRIGIHYREGGHNHGLKDWQVLLDFLEWQLQGKPTQTTFSHGPSGN